MQRNILLCTAISLLLFSNLYAANPVSVKQFNNHKDWSFVENLGQLSNVQGSKASDVRYYGHQGNVNLFCRPGSVSFVFLKADAASNNTTDEAGNPAILQKNPIPSQVIINRIDLVLLNSNPDANILATDQQGYYLNYFNDKGSFSNLRNYKTITYKDIYPHVDMVIHAKAEGLKYEFIVYPGGNASDIQLQWKGVKNLEMTENGGITYAFKLGQMDESKPVCFQGKNPVPGSFIKHANTISFKVGEYNNSQNLVIDPSLSWATFFGGSAADVGNAVATDASDNAFITGYTLSTSGIATSGAYLTSNSGTDAYISKFDKSGNLVWSTYYGIGSEAGNSIATDASGNVFINGTTSASSGIATSGAYQTSYSGSVDAFLAKFDNSGNLKWGTYFGGTGAESGNGVATDASGNVYITGKTGSSAGIATSGAYQTSLGGSTDAFVASFTNAGAINWATYYGGTGNDVANGIAVTGSTSVYITGATTSKTQMATSGTYQTAEAGANDAFLSKFDGSGNLVWGTYFGGNSDDYSESVAIDGSGNALITGYTGSSTKIATSGAYQTKASGGGTDGFIAAFNSSGTIEWGSYFGGVWADYCYGIASDGANNVYITGTTASLKNIATSGAYQTSYQGNNDAFLAKFRTNGAIQVSTYFGGGGNDVGQGVAVFDDGDVYLTGTTSSTSMIATSGAYLTSNAGGSSDAFLAKFNFFNYNDAGVDSVLSPKGTFCPGYQSVSVKFGNYGLGNMTKVNLNWSINRVVQNPYAWTGTLSVGGKATATIGSFNFFTGNDTIRAWTSKPNGVTDSSTSNDTATLIDAVNPLPAASVIPSTAICPSSSISIGNTAVSGDTYSWSSSPSGLSSTSSNPSVNPSTTTIYTLTETITATGCTNTHTDTISVPVSPVSRDTAICIGFSTAIGGLSYPGNMYSWTSSPPGFTSTSVNPTVKPNVTTTYYLKDSIAAGCTSIDSIKVTINPLPFATVIPSTAICSGNSISIGTSAISGHNYSWTSSPAGFTSTDANPSVSPSGNTVYSLTETITATGCINSHSDTISLPTASVIANTSICLGSNILIGGPSFPGHTYSWTSSPSGFTSTLSNPTVSPSVSTTYYLTDSSLAGCSKTDTIVITMKPLPNAQIAPSTVLCPGASISMGAKRISGDNYIWSSIPAGFTSTSSNPFLSPISTAIYFETETNPSTGCSRTNFDTITVPFAKVRKDTAVCSGTKVSLGGPSYKYNYYSWSSSPGSFSSTLANPSVVVNVTTKYQLIDTTAFGCGDTSTVRITARPSPTPKILTSSAICTGDSVNLGGPNDTLYTYSWTSSPSGFTSTISNPKVGPGTTTVYFLSSTDTSNGCSRVYSDTISFPSEAKIHKDTTICAGSPVLLSTTSYGGNIYSWTSSPAGFTSTIGNPVVTPITTTTYYFKDTSLAGCSKQDSVKITAIAIPLAKTVSPTTICAGTAIPLGASPLSGNKYVWTSSPTGFTSTLSNPYAKPNVTTTYYLTESVISTGCTTTNSVTITVNPIPSAYVLPSTAICSGSSISIGAKSVSGIYYSWESTPSGFTSNSSNPTVNPTITTIYTLTAQNLSTGCSNINSDTISIPAVSVIANTSICSGSSISIGGISYTGNSYSWTSVPAGFTSTSANPSVSPSANTTYTVKDTTNGCSKTSSVTITVNPLPAAKTISNMTVCAGSPISIGAASVSGSKYNWTSSPSGFSSTSSNPSLNPASSATYNLTETITGTGCSKSNSVSITVNPLPSAFVAANTAICSGGSVSLGGSTVAGDSYSWTSVPTGFSSSISNPTDNPTTTTIYTLVETNTSTGCSRTNSDTISVPTATVITDTSICIGSSISIGGKSYKGDIYSWTSSPSGFTSTSSNPKVSPTVNTTYFLKDSVANGCSKSSLVKIGLNPLPSASVIANTTICSGSSISIGNTAVSGDSYSWTSSPAGFSSTSANPSVNTASTKTYSLVETINATGCKNSNSVKISTNPLPAASVIANTAICPGNSISIGAASVSGNTYSWTSVPSGFTSTTSNTSVSPTLTTTYFLTETNGTTGCSKTDSVTISVPTTNVIKDTAICFGTTVFIGGPSFAGNIYSWTSAPSGFSSTSSNPSVSPATTTTYYLKDSIAAGCSLKDSVKVTINPLPSAYVIPDTAICSGSSVAIGGSSVASHTYLWSSVPSGFSSTLSNPTVNPTVNTAYTLTETNTLTGCVNSHSDTVSVPAAFVVSDTLICAGSPILLGALPVKGHLYSWSSSPAGFSSTISNPNVNPTQTTTYYLKDSVPAGCSKIDSVKVTVNPIPAAKLIASTSICSGGSIAIGDSSVSGDVYLWSSSPSGFSSTAYNPTVSPTVSTIYTLKETITATGCSNSNSDTISVPAFNIISDTSICYGSSIHLGKANYAGNSYSWTSSPSGFTSTLANPSVSPLTQTKYYLKDTLGSGCGSTDSVTISVNPLPDASKISDTTICAFTSISIGAKAVSGSSYNWVSKPAGFTSTSSNPTVNPAKSTVFYITETNTTTGCSKTDSVIITVNPLPAASVKTGSFICKGSSDSIGNTAVSGSTYSWTSSPAGFTSTDANPSVTPLKTTIYTLTETDTITGCVNTNSDTLTVPSVSIIANTAICTGSSISIGGASKPGNKYSWTSSPTGFSSTSSNPTVNPTTTTSYYVVDSMNGCGTLDTVKIKVNALPLASVIPDTSLCAGSKISLGSKFISGHSYTWASVPSGFSSSISNPTDSPTVTTQYTLTETIVSTGCQNSNTVKITANPLPAASVLASTAICSSTSVSIGASAISGDTYSWTSNPSGFTSTSSNPSVKPTSNTIYILTETNTTTGCSKTNSDTISMPRASIATNATVCAGTPTAIGDTAFAGNMYSWTSSPSGFTSTLANPVVKPTKTTTYYYKDSVLNGCSIIDSVQITVDPLPAAATIANTAICSSLTPLTIGAAAVSGSKYSWASSPFGFSNNTSNPKVSPTKTTSYFLTETNANTGCSKTDTVVISFASATVGSSATICAGSSVTIGGKAYTGDYYKWTSSPTGFTSTVSSPKVSPLTTTTYTLKDSVHGCSNVSNTVTITVNKPPAAQLIPSATNCSGNAISIGAKAVSGDTYLWTSLPAGFSSTSANPTVNPTSTTIYFLTETNTALGCSTTNSDTISLPSAPVANDTSICAGTPINIGKAFTTFKGNLYSWTSSPAGFTSTLTNPVVSPLTTTTYYFKDSVISQCSKTSSVTITTKSMPSVNIIPSTAICSGAVSIGAAPVTNFIYSWTSFPAGFTSTVSDPSVSPASATIYTLKVKDTVSGCSNSNSDTVYVLSGGTVIANTSVCSGNAIAIGGASYSGNLYSWTSSPAGFTSSVADPIVSPTTTTTYYLNDSIPSGCGRTDSVTLTVIPLPNANPGSNATVCAGTSVGIGAAAVSGNKYSWTSSPSGFTSTLSNPSVAPTVTTTYYNTETIIATGCSKTDSVNVFVNPLPTASVIANTAICSGSYIFLGAGSVSGNKYSWTSVPPGFNSVLANPVASPLVKTTYTLTDTSVATGCYNSNSVTISVNPLPVAAVIANSAICLRSAISLGAKAVSGDKYAWSSSPSGFTSTSSSPSVSPSAATTYYMTETIAATGCTNSDSVKITVNPLPAAPVASNATVCQGTVKYLGDSAVAGDTYLWSSSATSFVSDSADPKDSFLTTTTYSLKETITATGCSNTNSVTITVNPLPVAATANDTTVCGNTAVNIGQAAVTGDTYSWSSAPGGFTSTTSNPKVRPLVTTTYYLTETITATGCLHTDSMLVTAKPLPAANAGNNSTICAGSSGALGVNAVAGNNYTWISIPPGFTSTFADPAVFPTSTTIYVLKDSFKTDGCTKTDTVTITVKPIPAAAIIANTSVCSGYSILLGAAPVKNSTYSWASNPSGFVSDTSNPTANPTVFTTYYLTETSSNTGCSKTDSVKISINPLPNATVRADTIDCSGAPILIGSPSTKGDKYSWVSIPAGFSSTLSNPAPTPTSPTTYALTETITATGCSKTDTVKISITPAPVASVGSDKAICPGSNVIIGDLPVSGNSYYWTSTPSGFTSTSSNPSVNPTKTTVYTLTETISATGCSTIRSVTITVVPFPDAKVLPNSAICKGASIYLGAAPVTGHTYSWTSSQGGFTSTISDPVVNPTSATSYTLTEVNTQAGCKSSNSVTITVKPFPAAKVIADTSICLGSYINIGASLDTGSAYDWSSSPSGFSSLLSNPSVSPTGTTTYRLTQTYTASGCFNSNSVTIKVNALPAAKVAPDISLCPGTPYQIGDSAAKPGFKYSWSSFPSGFSSTASDPSVRPTATTTYILNETDNSTGCNNTNTVTLTLIPVPLANAGTNSTICEGTPIKLGASAVSGDSYSWTSTPPGFSSNVAAPTLKPTVTTTYYVRETNALGCNNTDSVIITVNPLPDAHWSGIFDSKGNANFSADSLKYKSYNWSFGNTYSSTSSTASTTYYKSGKYTVSLTTESNKGCQNTFDSVITIHIHTSGIEGDSAQSFDISLYPNPFISAATLNYSLTKSSKVTVMIMDITGKQVGIIEDVNQVAGEYNVSIDAEKLHMKPGIYLMKFITDDGYISRTMIKL